MHPYPQIVHETVSEAVGDGGEQVAARHGVVRNDFVLAVEDIASREPEGNAVCKAFREGDVMRRPGLHHGGWEVGGGRIADSCVYECIVHSPATVCRESGDGDAVTRDVGYLSHIGGFSRR